MEEATGPLPSMIDLYRNDIRQYPDSHLDLPIRVAHKICDKFPKYWPYLMDFIQEGNIELLRCVDVFNEQHQHNGSNNDFRNYAAACIRGVIYRYFSRIPTIYIPSASRKVLFLERGRHEELLILEHGVSFEMLYEQMLDVAEPTNMQEAFCKARQKQVQSLLDRLPTRERQVIRHLYGLDGVEYDHHEIAQELNVVAKQILVTKRNAIKRMQGVAVRPAMEHLKQQHEQEREARLQTIYDQHHGSISIAALTRLAHCGKQSAREFLLTHRQIPLPT